LGVFGVSALKASPRFPLRAPRGCAREPCAAPNLFSVQGRHRRIAWATRRVARGRRWHRTCTPGNRIGTRRDVRSRRPHTHRTIPTTAPLTILGRAALTVVACGRPDSRDAEADEESVTGAPPAPRVSTIELGKQAGENLRVTEPSSSFRARDTVFL